MHGTARRGSRDTSKDLVRGRRIRPPVSRRGISLIETLVAFAIVAVAMTVLAQLMSWAMHESAFSRRRAEATLLAQERMEDLLAHRADLAAWEAAAKKAFEFDPKTEAYCFDEPGHPRPELDAFRWTWLIEDMKDHPGLKKISVQLRWLRSRSRGRRRKARAVDDAGRAGEVAGDRRRGAEPARGGDPMNISRRRDAGFTLIEIMVTAALTAIVVGMGFGLLTSAQQIAQLQQEQSAAGRDGWTFVYRLTRELREAMPPRPVGRRGGMARHQRFGKTARRGLHRQAGRTSASRISRGAG